MKTISYGIIGMGNQGKYLSKFFQNGETPNACLTAICDIDPNKLDATVSENCFTDYLQMIESGLIDAVIVAVPHYDHPKICIDCLNAGIHTICEKPAGVYTEQVHKMNEVAMQSNAMFTMMFNQRTNCVYRKMREMIASGAIGRFQRLTWIVTDWFRNQKYYDSASWRATWAGEGGGVLINQCPHQIDLMQWIVGEMPKFVNAFCHNGKWHDIEVEDDVTAYFEYESGATGVFITTTGEAPGTNRLEISGTGGKLLCENGILKYYRNDEDSQVCSRTSARPFSRPKCREEIVETDGENFQHKGIINNFTQAILWKEKLFVDGKEGIFGVEIMNAFELSSWTQSRVAIPVNETLYVSELQKRQKLSKRKNCIGMQPVDPVPEK